MAFKLGCTMRTFTTLLCAALLASCAHAPGASSLPPGFDSGALGFDGLPGATTFTLLHAFSGGSDGKDPYGDLAADNGILYGTTLGGGTHGVGTVFKITTSGSEQVLHSFQKGKGDGQSPRGALVAVGGTLYGTTLGGGASGKGTVFAISPSGTENVIYSFKGGKDGATPEAGLTNLNGTLYGTTFAGGSGKAGTVYKITTSGAESVLYSFKTSGSDGHNPYAGVTAVKGVLYGTTYLGGATDAGAVFKVTTGGSEAVLHSFKVGKDGVNPYASLVAVNGTLYGTTSGGGAHGFGAIFKITTSGTEKVIHSFNLTAGSTPYSRLIEANGTLYGTTYTGGKNYFGTIFKVTTSGTETVLHSFKATDGKFPFAGVTDVNGTLYGTTIQGAAHNDGSVFKLAP